MARSYTFGDVVSMINNVIPKTTEDDKVAHICNLAQNKIWRRYDFKETLSQLPPFSLTPGDQDYSAPAIAVPADFNGLRIAQFVQMTSIPAFRTDLKIYKDLVYTQVQSLPECICYEPSIQGFRIYPRCPNNIGGPIYKIDGVYKRLPDKIFASTVQATLLPFEDQYLSVWVEALRWAGWSLAGDPRAGQVVISAGKQMSYSGQLAVAMAELDNMASNEGLFRGDANVTPVDNPWYD